MAPPDSEGGGGHEGDGGVSEGAVREEGGGGSGQYSLCRVVRSSMSRHRGPAP